MHAIAVEYIASGNRFRAFQVVIDRAEIGIDGGLEKIIEAVDDEIGFLEGVDAIARAHHPLHIETDAVWRRRFKRVDRLALR